MKSKSPLIALLVLLLPLWTGAADFQMRFDSAEGMDRAGRDLRRAVTAWQLAGRSALSHEWQTLNLAEQETAQLDGGLRLLLVQRTRIEEKAALRLLLVDAATGAETADVAEGAAHDFAAVSVQAVKIGSGAERALLLVRRRGEAALLTDAPASGGSPTITGTDATRILMVSSSDPAELEFCRRFLFHRNGGKTAEDAAREARREVPPPSRTVSVEDSRHRPRDPWEEAAAGAWHSATITIHSLLGEDAALKELESSWSYTNQRPMNPDPRVRIEGGGDGATVDIGSPGDAVQARIRAAEKTGRVRMEGQTLARVMAGERTRLYINRGGEQVALDVGATRAGNAVLLDVDMADRGRGSGSSTSTRLRVRPGQTVTLSKFESSREESFRSGPPLLPDLPFIGGIFGNSRDASYSVQSAVYVTVEVE